MFDRDVLIAMGSLERGVIIPGCDIAEQLRKMSPSDARKAKRKWRKLIRKAKKKIEAHPERYKMKKRHFENAVWSSAVSELLLEGHKKING